MSVIEDHFLVNTNLSPMDFQKMANVKLCVEDIKNAYIIENDFSKYDKSQGLAVLTMECELKERFGVEYDLVELWRYMHEISFYVDRKNEVASKVDYQRRSGDPSTFAFNTFFSMAMIAAVYDTKHLESGFFGGDDSLLWTFEKSLTLDKSLCFADIGNLECKFMKYDFPYFCTKFVLIIKDYMYIVPDPVKLIMKLGRSDLLNFEHVEEYRISCEDNYKVFENVVFHDALSSRV